MADIAQKQTTQRFGNILVTETKDLPASATTEYGTVFEVKPGPNNARYVHGWVQCSAVTGTNVDFGLYGADTLTGTKRALKAAVVTALTDGTLTPFVIELKAEGYAPFLFFGWTSDADESANTIAYGLTIPNEN